LLLFIEGRFDGQDFAKKMAVPNAMLAVVPDNPPIIAAMDLPVYECKIETHHFPGGVYPDFSPQLSVSPASRYLMSFVHDLNQAPCSHDSLYHAWCCTLQFALTEERFSCDFRKRLQRCVN
jgi:hypothetical protein